jgi:hypothetical protein
MCPSCLTLGSLALVCRQVLTLTPHSPDCSPMGCGDRYFVHAHQVKLGPCGIFWREQCSGLWPRLMVGRCLLEMQEEEAEQAREEEAKKKRLERKERKRGKKTQNQPCRSEVRNPEHLINARLATAWHQTPRQCNRH